MTDTDGKLDIDLAEPAQEPVAAPMPAQGMRASTLLDALRNHYAAPKETFPGGVFLTEVVAPGPNASRRADALWINFARSRDGGWGIDVCELKVTRADFVHEIAQPLKAEAWWPYSTRWWIVSPSPTITPPDLLPDGWGLMCPGSRGRRFTVHRKPAVREPQVDLDLLITLAKKIDLERPKAARDAEWRAAQKHYDEMEALRREAGLVPGADAITRNRLKRLDELERLAGVSLEDWSSQHQASPTDLAAAMRAALAINRATSSAATQSRNLLRHLGTARANLDRVEEAARDLVAAAQLPDERGESAHV